MISGIVEMKAFKNHFPSIFPEAASNSSNRSCVSESGNDEEAILVVSCRSSSQSVLTLAHAK